MPGMQNPVDNPSPHGSGDEWEASDLARCRSLGEMDGSEREAYLPLGEEIQVAQAWEFVRGSFND